MRKPIISFCLLYYHVCIYKTKKENYSELQNNLLCKTLITVFDTLYTYMYKYVHIYIYVYMFVLMHAYKRAQAVLPL